MDYGDLLKRSWDIVWHNKFLFILGFLAALGAGRSGGSSFRRSFNPGSGSGSDTIPPEMVERVQSIWAQFGAMFIGLFCVLLIVGVILWLVRLTAQTGMIEAVSRIDAGEKMTFSQTFAAGTAKLGRMLGVNVVMYGPFFLVGMATLLGFGGMLVTAVGTQASGGSFEDLQAVFGGLGLAGICLTIVACLMVPVMLVVTIVYPFAQRGAVLQNLGVVASIKHGWQVVKDNAGDVALLVVLFIALGFVFGLLSIPIIMPFAAIFLDPGIFSMIASEGSFGYSQIALLTVGSICVGLVGSVINSIMTTFRSTVVTLAYQEFMSKEV